MTGLILFMFRLFDFVLDRQKLFAVLLIGLWLLIPCNLLQPVSALFDDVEQEEPLESIALNRGLNTYEAERQLSLKAGSAWPGGHVIVALTLRSHRSNPRRSVIRDLRIYTL